MQRKPNKCHHFIPTINLDNTANQMSLKVSNIAYVFLLIVVIAIASILWRFRGVSYEPFGVNDNSYVSLQEEFRRDMQNMREAVRNQRALLEEIACATTKIGARGGFCLTEKEVNVGYNNMWDLPMSIRLEENLFNGASVGDLGAGLGWYGRFWLRKTGTGLLYNAAELERKTFTEVKSVQDALAKPQKIKSWEGFDGAGNVEKLSSGFIKYLDLSEPLTLPTKYDWVLSLEVGEHIPGHFETIFLDNICLHARTGIVLSWAVEGQSGHFHVNNRNNSYIKDKMASRGFDNDLDEEKMLRAGSGLGHFKNTVMVFRRKVPLS